MLINKDTGQEAVPARDMIFEAGTADFEEKVLKASMEAPVIAYFTAPWCGPCKQLGPLLDKAVQEQGGAVRMARINLDNNQELASALRIQSVPTVFGFFQGRPVDAFQGAVSGEQIKSFIHKLLQAGGQDDTSIDIPAALQQAGQALAAGDLQTAQAIYGQILSQDEHNAPAYAGMVRTFLAAGQVEQARDLVENAPDEIAGDPVFGEARTALELAETKPAEDLGALEDKLEKNPDDLQARYDLALGQFSAGQKEKAIENLLEILRRNQGWNDEQARTQLLKFFEALGPADPLAMAGRRKLSSLLFS